MADTGHKSLRFDGKTITQRIEHTMRQESQMYGVPMPTEKQMALVISALRMHPDMVHASQYDFSEPGAPDTPTDFYPIQSSIGRYYRDAAYEILNRED